MTVMIHKPAERETVLLQAYREELVERIGRVISFDGTVQPLQGLHLYHNSVPMERVYGVVEPSLCVVAQGSKEFLLGESHYRYDPFHYLLVRSICPTSARSWKPRRSGHSSASAWNLPPPLSVRLCLRPVTPSLEILLMSGPSTSAR